MAWLIFCPLVPEPLRGRFLVSFFRNINPTSLALFSHCLMSPHWNFNLLGHQGHCLPTVCSQPPARAERTVKCPDYSCWLACDGTDDPERLSHGLAQGRVNGDAVNPLIYCQSPPHPAPSRIEGCPRGREYCGVRCTEPTGSLRPESQSNRHCRRWFIYWFWW